MIDKGMIEVREERLELVRLQAAEPHHRRIGVALPGHKHPPTLEQVCRRCPSRKRCTEVSVSLAELETMYFSRKCQLCDSVVLESVVSITWCDGCHGHICAACSEAEEPLDDHDPIDHLTDLVRRQAILEARKEKAQVRR